MILKLLLFPLKFFFYPWYLRWIFRLPWFVFAAIAVWLGFLASDSNDDYRAELIDADVLIAQGAPGTTALSTWNATTDVTPNDEVNVLGLYFTALPETRFEASGRSRDIIFLADDQGREVKAVLVATASQISQLRAQLQAQSAGGDRFPVTVNGTLNRDAAWSVAIRSRMMALGVPAANELVVIEPFIGTRTAAITRGAERARSTAALIAGIATLFGLLAVMKIIWALFMRRRSSDTQSQMSGSDAQAARTATVPTRHISPSADSPEQASPWAQFKPQDRTDEPKQISRIVKPQAMGQTGAVGQPKAKPRTETLSDSTLPLPVFKSVFPGGGSSFRYKSADQIIRQAFGTVSTLKASTASIAMRKLEK